MLALVQPSVERLNDPRVAIQLAVDASATSNALIIKITGFGGPAESYRLTSHYSCVIEVEGGDKLGVLYGLGHALEALGYRFAHPLRTRKPTAIPTQFAPLPDTVQLPAISKRRGLHLHTIHPTEAHFDFWQPSAEHLVGAKATADFVVHNRGNYLQWVALDNITDDKVAHAAWRDHTRAITSYGHGRGLKLGIAIQLFGASNLQKGFDLVDEGGDAQEMERRLRLVVDGNGFDTVNLSFGEFSAADPAAFVAQVDQVYALLLKIQPTIEMTATIHVGNQPDLQVTYKGKTQLYYFLVDYANPAIVPWVHTVMYYNLFEDAGGAYGHAQFDEHRAFLLERLQGSKPVGYFPETAYWVAFDVCVPLFLPVYMRSRWLDLQQIAAKGHKLVDHVLFSSGWEWGYWQHDAYALRTSFTLPTDWTAPLHEWWHAWGAVGGKAATRLAKLGNLQRDALIGARLAAYLAGRDVFIDLGFQTGTVAQPNRMDFAALAKAPAVERQQFRDKVLIPLINLSNATAELAADALGEVGADPWLHEMYDGMEVTAQRGRFVAALYAAVLAQADGDPKLRDLKVQEAETVLAAAEIWIGERHAALWDPQPKRLLARADNATLYPYGYLYQADTLCFWKRERAQVHNLLLGAGLAVPACVL